MKRKTYNNMIKATQIIEKKGYTHTEANEIAMKCFDNMEQSKNGMSVEFFINQIASKQEWEEGVTL